MNLRRRCGWACLAFLTLLFVNGGIPLLAVAQNNCNGLDRLHPRSAERLVLHASRVSVFTIIVFDFQLVLQLLVSAGICLLAKFLPRVVVLVVTFDE